MIEELYIMMKKKFFSRLFSLEFNHGYIFFFLMRLYTFYYIKL